ncbi:6-phosphofructokinase-like protein [Dinothrombium tinctorium]|uniref:6-phosphofructokinase n=1 Tax=Dinothrombium tinctorium TaxID=1965070 RepID=A0A443QTW3_9ACAR|nr:6-phosphofructokinase-like protein [Dinothrombium tinctorium]
MSKKTAIFKNLDKIIGVTTSGSETQGMNAAIRAVVRMSLFLGLRVFFIKNGFRGMIDGGDHIIEASWYSVSNIIALEGTEIGTARCEELFNKENRMKAAFNLIHYGITNLVVIGGRGSLMAASRLKDEWSSMIYEMEQKKLITSEARTLFGNLKIVCLVTSIYKDFWSSDYTIGFNSALSQISETIDSIVKANSSQQKIFILNLKDERCGVLLLFAAIASGADYVFLPDIPAESDWQQNLHKKLTQQNEMNQRVKIVIVAEGAKTQAGDVITAELIKQTIADQFNIAAEIISFEHLQKGGNPTAFDRILAIRAGVAAVITMICFPQTDEGLVIISDGNRLTPFSLKRSIDYDSSIVTSLNKGNLESVLNRDKNFRKYFQIFKFLTQVQPTSKENKRCFTLAILNIGSPAPGMNAVLHAFVRRCIHNGNKVLGINNGIDGFVEGNIKPLSWHEVSGSVRLGAALLGCRPTTAKSHLDKISERIEEFKIDALVIIGGFPAFESAIQILKARKKYQSLNIPLCVIPASINNNMPGTDITIGADTALNEITTACGKTLLSARGLQKRVFIVETMGDYCGYLTTMAAIASGADIAYTFEESITLKVLAKDIEIMKQKIRNGLQTGLILVNENANSHYTTEFIYNAFEEESEKLYSAKFNVSTRVGHLQGDTPSSFDRILATEMATEATDWIITQLQNKEILKNKFSTSECAPAVLIGIRQQKYYFTRLNLLEQEANFEYRLPLQEWWLHLIPVLKAMETPVKAGSMHHKKQVEE